MLFGKDNESAVYLICGTFFNGIITVGTIKALSL